MDFVVRKRCGNCRFLQEGSSGCTGRCTNLIWQPRTDAIRFVRPGELGCYQAWGTSFWQPKTNGHQGTGGPGPGPNGSSGTGGGSLPFSSGTSSSTMSGVSSEDIVLSVGAEASDARATSEQVLSDL